MATDKSSLRKKLLQDRLAIGPDDWAKRSLQICERLLLLEPLQKARRVALYKSFRKEVDLEPLIGLLPDKDYYFPRSQLEDNSMDFHRYAGGEFVKNRWGLDEPSGGESLRVDEEALIIVPGLAYDRRGHRLGYGKGYYDRFLSSHNCKTIGVCFSEFLFDQLPAEAHDRVVDYVVCESLSLAVTKAWP